MKSKLYLYGCGLGVILLFGNLAYAQNLNVDFSESHGRGITSEWIQFHQIIVKTPFENTPSIYNVAFKVCQFDSGRLYLSPLLEAEPICQQNAVGVDFSISTSHGFNQDANRVQIDNLRIKKFNPDVPQSMEMTTTHSVIFKLNLVTLNLEQEGEFSHPLRRIQISLDWHDIPLELDAHLTGPIAHYERFHLYFGEQSSNGNVAILDVGYDEFETKPETVTILPPPGAENFRPGTYRFIVHHFYGDGKIVDSGARVHLWIGDEAEPHVFEPPPESIIPLGGEMDAWVVFALEINQEGMITILPLQYYEIGVSPYDVRRQSRTSK